mmetsp:Transcript_38951/g.62193  ORF Transcript_38951/g.62193 Transcript_38951/m.62193 type:complete len:377 (-) Transcript_38951:643-1773(-)
MTTSVEQRATSSDSASCLRQDTGAVSKTHSSDVVAISNIAAVLKYVGFTPLQKLADTLQGQIWSVVNTESGAPLVVKIASKALHEKKTAIANNEKIVTHEDILKETSILRYLNSFTNCPPSIIGYHGFVYTESEYYLIMANGGRSMFDFVQKGHSFIRQNRLAVQHWKEVVRIISKQIIAAVDFMHRHNVCHNDISVENMTLKDVPVLLEDMHSEQSSITFVDAEKNIHVKLVDFGLAEKFDASESENQSIFSSKKYCGKINYQSPEIVKKRGFNAASNDIWCIGICLFMMTAGTAPWNIAHESDASYSLMMKKRSLFPMLLKQWNVLHHFDEQLLDLLLKIFQPESKRITMPEIKKHPWLLANDGDKARKQSRMQ